MGEILKAGEIVNAEVQRMYKRLTDAELEVLQDQTLDLYNDAEKVLNEISREKDRRENTPLTWD
jgi:hypothetical protein